MKRLLTAVALLLAGAFAAPPAAAAGCRAPLEAWSQIELYFGRNIGTDDVVPEAAFRRFLAEVVTPRFPDGLTVVDAAGQFRDQRGRIIREPSKLLILLVPDAAEADPKIRAVIGAYKRRFDQESVLRTEQAVCLAF